MRYILSLVVENKHGVLSKISQVITGRGYNINTLSVAPCELSDMSRMIITFDCDEDVIKQVIKHLNKLIDVIKVFLIDENEKVERELVLIRVARKKDTEESLYRIVEIFKGKFVDVALKNFVIELTGHSKKINAFIETVKPFGLQDLMRTGPLALPKFDIK
jgi:acetolactate synthase-1/3 small subunit